VKALLVGDIHLADRPPSVRTESYAEDILAKLAFCVEYASEHADVMVLLGDVFHIKAPSKTSHRLVQRTAEVLEKFRPRNFTLDRGPGRVLIVPGNHDMSQDRIESLESQPLGTLALARNVELLTGYDDQTGIFGIPYLQDWTDLPRWLTEAGGADLIATHAPIFPTGEEPPYEFIRAEDVAYLLGSAVGPSRTPVAYGHIHDPHGFYKVEQNWFCNNGAISRGSLHEKTVKRHPKVTLFDSDAEGCPFTSVDVPHRPAEDVFRLAEHREEVAAEQRLDDFVASISDVSLAALSMEEVVARAADSGLSPDAQRELGDIVEVAVHQ
jgi:DNA repair exonuclease SbcCD nuclease subunit